MFITILRRHLRYLGPSESLTPETPLREFGLDSMEAVALVLDLEYEFGITLPKSSLGVETFASAANLWVEVDKLVRL